MAKVLIFFSLLYVVFAQGDIRPTLAPTRCRVTTLEQLLAGCPRNCVIKIPDTRCLECNDSCTDVPEVCSPARGCADNQICLAAGVTGRYICEDLIAEGGACSVGVIDLSQVIDVAVPCSRGLLCVRTRTGGVCMAEGTDGPCSSAKVDNTELNCDVDGNFVPLQCRRLVDLNGYMCRCVRVVTGEVVPGTERDITETPNCDNIVLERCRYNSTLGNRYEARSGEMFTDPQTCNRCLCVNGVPTFCVSLSDDSCDRLNPTPMTNRNCSFRGRMFPHGATFNYICNKCKCSNGVVTCTRRACQEEDPDEEEGPIEDRNCRACSDMRADPVCGRDGRTYPSQCFVENCRGLTGDKKFSTGPCSMRDVCAENPCGDGQACLRTEGVVCLSREGCRTDRLRKCVDLETLRCRSRGDDDDGDGDSDTPTREPSDGGATEEPTEEGTSDGDDEDDEDDAVCGSDRRTYASICNLLQNSAEIRVAHAGRCNRTECSGGPVCGTDDETYDNICVLRTNSANARLEYRGECMADVEEEMVADRCERVRRSERCGDLTDCASRTRPEDGCCLVCGGAVTIGLDRDAVDEYVRLNPTADTVDEFLRLLISSGFIPDDVLERCQPSAALLDTGDLSLVLENIVKSDRVCAMFVETIADKINNPPNATTTEAANPQILQLATVAQTSPQVEEAVGPTNGAVCAVSYSVVMMLAPLMTLFM